MLARPRHVCCFTFACIIADVVFSWPFSDGLSRAGEPVDLPPVVLQMLRNDAVFEDLKLSGDERTRVAEVMDRADGPWWRSRIMQDAQRIAAVRILTQQVKAELQTFLSPETVSRIAQLERQSLGTRMFLLDDVIATLEISPTTAERMIALTNEIDASLMDLQSRAAKGEPSKALEAEKRELAKRELTSIVALLTPEQKTRVKSLTGAPFDFSKIQRTFPRAPELIQSPEHWLQGSPTSLAELRGQVVAVHFYAFQCINCQRNLPLYSDWHTDYADRGLVVIGIQTPETSSEREPAKVVAAAKRDKIDYRVLMDAESQNWRAWGTTMWPTVYLIDRQGYIRSWWPGEMNWQGKPGEQQMRSYIEALLKEPV